MSTFAVLLLVTDETVNNPLSPATGTLDTLTALVAVMVENVPPMVYELVIVPNVSICSIWVIAPPSMLLGAVGAASKVLVEVATTLYIPSKAEGAPP